ncbi:hypothetical protein V5P93_004929 [Actinokineospora auranticolor]|uniref:HAF family extracellular repeat protein n=1 Tax=Actinokineospora auranticolor TaxID=155976 RepID=A0A2S6GNT7_9PSEU|nr:hypothetical protein [Actinokineospora auranticolor]PPK66889.1 hypothetical protein CLV40_109274 [Actinokineospora auranticolor]
MWRRLAVVVTVPVLVVGGSAVAVGQPSSHGCAAIELVPLPGDAWADANDVNEDGVAVGVSGVGKDIDHAVMWSRDRLPVRLEPLGANDETTAVAINDAGVVMGTETTPVGERAVRWDRKGAHELVPLPGDVRSLPTAINGRGDVVGRSVSSAGYNARVVLWGRSGAPVELSVPPNHLGDVAGVTDAGVAYGFLEALDGSHPLSQAAFWRPDGALRLLEVPEGSVYSEVEDVNERGVAVGRVNGTAYRWDADGHGQPLDDLAEENTDAFAVNSRGESVGISVIAFTRGTRWGRAGHVRELFPPADTWMPWPHDINDRGVVVGTAQRGWDTYPVVWAAGSDQATELLDPHGAALTGGGAAKVTNSGYVTGGRAGDRGVIWRLPRS